MSRQHDLESGIRESYALIREYEGILRLSSDPREKARARQAMTEQWELIRDSLVPYQRLVGADFPEDIRQIAARFQVRPAAPPHASPGATPTGTVASAERSVAISGGAPHSIIVTGDITITLPGGDTEALRQALEAALGGEGGTPPGPGTAAPNPFTPLAGRIDDPSLFFDRKQELGQSFNLLNSGSSVALIGEAGVGKSSLLREICRRAPERLAQARRAVYLSLLNTENELEFYEDLCEKLDLPTCRGRALARSLRDKRFLLALDELDKISWDVFGRDVRAQLRGLAEGQNAPLRLVVAARAPLDRLFPDSEGMVSPLAGICLQVAVGPWGEATARAFVAQRLAGTGVAFPDAEVNKIIAATRGHPQRLMRHCWDLYERLAGGGP